jgi:hypothetical protein
VKRRGRLRDASGQGIGGRREWRGVGADETREGLGGRGRKNGWVDADAS